MAIASDAHADFARPPEPSPYRPDRFDTDADAPIAPYDPGPGWADEPPDTASSMLRFHIGPAVLLEPASPGLFTALDIGRKAVGARLSGSWLRPESDRGLSAYTAELWIDFRHRYELHPIIAAGASWLHGGAVGEDENAGAGLLRGALEYELPISDADARLGLNVTGLVPAMGTERTRPWATVALTIGAGF